MQVTEFQVVDHGLENSQYFQGCGVAFTPYEHVATGNGDNFTEAINDALESIAQQYSAIDFPALESEIRKAGFAHVDGGDRWIESPSASEQDSSEDSELTYYVSVRYNISTDEA